MTGFSSDFDGLDLDDGELLAVPLLPLVALAFLLLEDDDLIPALVLENLRGNRRAGKGGRAHLEIGALARGQHVANLNGRAGLRVRKAVHDQDIALRHGELLSLSLDGGSHEIKPLNKLFRRFQRKAILEVCSRAASRCPSRSGTRPRI